MVVPFRYLASVVGGATSPAAERPMVLERQIGSPLHRASAFMIRMGFWAATGYAPPAAGSIGAPAPSANCSSKSDA